MNSYATHVMQVPSVAEIWNLWIYGCEQLMNGPFKDVYGRCRKDCKEVEDRMTVLWNI